MKKPTGLRTWVEIDAKAVSHNYKTFRSLISPTTRLMAVVKSNAYGHDLFQFARIVERLGTDWLGVDSITEALALRQEKVKTPILVLGYTLPEKFPEAIKNNVSLTISSFESLDVLDTRCLTKIKPLPLKIHLKIDTGMHRQGFQEKEIPKVLAMVKKLKNIEVEGIFSHFGQADNSKKTKKQLKKILEILAVFEKEGIKPIRHISATGGTLASKENHLDMARVGIGLYGIYPSDNFEKKLSKKIKLRPVLSWKAIVGEVKTVSAGECVGYDFTKKLTRKTRLAIIPIGYWHGYPRALSNKGFVFVRGKSAPVLGRVSMDMLTVDVTDIPRVKIGDEVELIGKNVSAKQLAKLSHTSPYEIITRLNPLMRRVYV